MTQRKIIATTTLHPSRICRIANKTLNRRPHTLALTGMPIKMCTVRMFVFDLQSTVPDLFPLTIDILGVVLMFLVSLFALFALFSLFAQ